METNGKKINVEKSTLGTPKKKSIIKKIRKKYVDLKTLERANLKQFFKRKFISQKAFKQIFAFLLFDKGGTMIEVMEELALSPQTLMQWRKDFKADRMKSLLVIQEQKKNDDDDESGEPGSIDEPS
jgi:hypothetical protein